ncbi:hypothetical protein ON010_g9307 [Phytophthora cinnamomi]|nr:hypothetical protein ON010_g9307 [Phytophthora cinnamomi]
MPTSEATKSKEKELEKGPDVYEVIWPQLAQAAGSPLDRERRRPSSYPIHQHFRAQGLKLDGGSVRRWWSGREKLLAADPSMRRLPGGGRRPLSAAMEDALYDEIVAKRLRKEKVTRAWIGHMARMIYASHHDDDTRTSPP